MKTTPCPKCNSSAPHRHPAVQVGGEVEICSHEYHLQTTPQNKPEYIALVQDKRTQEGGITYPADSATTHDRAELGIEDPA